MALALEFREVVPRTITRVPLVAHAFTYGFEGGRAYRICGKNGSGKTSLLNAAAGLLPHDGEISYGSQPPQRAVESGSLSYLFQHAPVPVFLTPAEFVRLARIPCDLVRSYLPTTHRNLVAVQRSMGALSGGEAQLVGLAVAFARAAKVCFLDEPLRFLTPENIAFACATIERLRSGGVCILVIEHARRDDNAAAARDPGRITVKEFEPCELSLQEY